MSDGSATVRTTGAAAVALSAVASSGAYIGTVLTAEATGGSAGSNFYIFKVLVFQLVV